MPQPHLEPIGALRAQVGIADFERQIACVRTGYTL